MSSLEGLPDSVLAQIPLLPPPPGVVSNFVNPPNNGTSFIVFGAVIVPVMLAFFSIRLYTKFCIIRQRSWDDLTCSLAALGAVLHYTVTTLCNSMVLGWGTRLTLDAAVTKGKFGRHCWDISIYDTSRPWYGITTYMVNWSATLILPFAKLTFYIFYINLFRPFKWIRILCYLGIVVTTTAYLGFLVAQLALTTPHPGESWLEMNEDPRPLKIPKYLSIPITALSFGTDLYIFALPILGIAKLDLTRHRKIGVSFVFMTGFA
ncbi:MAG: hypothetical protein M1820_008569 [Bogoriella megaspora]|nr:MAG: hypothetical protein M1820_008569 [Bogoriella megaspora]